MLRKGACILAGSLLLTACIPASSGISPTTQQALQSASQRQASLSVAILTPDAIPSETFTPLYRSAQAYADLTSERRDIPYFKLHPEAIGLRLKHPSSGEEAWLFSVLGTALTQADLNLEMRILASKNQTGMNLNYSGPVTQSRTTEADASSLSPRPQNNSGFSFELLMGLPGNGVIEAYGSMMNGLARQLQQRYQAQTFTFDDTPLVYACYHGTDLQGFLFLNQRNRLILGQRKYADVQSVVFITSQREIKAAYTLIGFNPKTLGAEHAPHYRWDNHGRFGHWVTFGQY